MLTFPLVITYRISTGCQRLDKRAFKIYNIYILAITNIDDLKAYTWVFRALGDPTRLRIAHLLLRADQELCVCEMVDSLEESQTNVSRHLRELKLAGLVKERREGRWIFYSLCAPSDPFLKGILSALESMEAPLLKRDVETLRARLSLRREGKCVVGMNSTEWQRLKLKIKRGS